MIGHAEVAPVASIWPPARTLRSRARARGLAREKNVPGFRLTRRSELALYRDQPRHQHAVNSSSARVRRHVPTFARHGLRAVGTKTRVTRRPTLLMLPVPAARIRAASS